MENRIIEDRLNKLEICKERHDNRLDQIEKQIIEMSTGYKKDFDLIFTMLKEIKEGLEKLKMEPGDKWKSASSIIISGIIGSVLMYIMMNVGF